MALVRISFEIRRKVSHSEREKILSWWYQGAGQCFNMSVGRGAVF